MHATSRHDREFDRGASTTEQCQDISVDSTYFNQAGLISHVPTLIYRTRGSFTLRGLSKQNTNKMTKNIKEHQRTIEHPEDGIDGIHGLNGIEHGYK